MSSLGKTKHKSRETKMADEAIKAGTFQFCGNSEQMMSEARKRAYQWRNKRQLKYFLASQVVGVENFAKTCKEAYDKISAVCGLTFEPSPTQASADIVIYTRKIDGPGGVLAEHELPPGNDQQIRGWIDKSDNYTNSIPPGSKILFPAVFLHESCHGCGLPHTKVPNSLMNAFYDPDIYNLTAWEIEQFKSLYGEPIVGPSEPDTPEPPLGGGVAVMHHPAVGYYIPVISYPKI